MTLVLKTVAQEYLLRLEDGVLTGGHVREEDIVLDDETGIVIARGDSVLTDLSATRLLVWSRLIKAVYLPPAVPEAPITPVEPEATGGAIAIDIINEPPIAPEPVIVPEPASPPAEPVTALPDEPAPEVVAENPEEIPLSPVEPVALETPEEVIASLPEAIVKTEDLNGQFAPQGANPDVQQASDLFPAPAQVNIVNPADGSSEPHVITVDPVQGTDPELRVPPETVPAEPEPVHTEEAPVVPEAAKEEAIASEEQIVQEALEAEAAEEAPKTPKGKK